jgi:hypothetical protein
MSDQTIWKYELAIEDVQTRRMPAGAKVLHVDAQHGHPCMWAMVDPYAAKVARTFLIRGSGHPAAGARAENHVGTVLVDADFLVIHVFEDYS